MDPALARLIDGSPLERVREGMRAAALASIRLRLLPVSPRVLAPGQSRLGGPPDLPPGVDWPCEPYGRPLAFIGQINLAEVAGLEAAEVLPPDGMLYFFYDAVGQPGGFGPAYAGGWEVIHSPGPVSSVTMERIPAALPPEARFRPCAARFAPEWTLPPVDSLAVRALRLSREEQDAYDALRERVEEMYGVSRARVHRLLGHPETIQGEMQTQCHQESAGTARGGSRHQRDGHASADGARDWTLLLQVDSDGALGTMWGDVGMIYYWIRRQDLERRRFDRIWLVHQCG